jgi:hypothetical protein
MQLTDEPRAYRPPLTCSKYFLGRASEHCICGLSALYAGKRAPWRAVNLNVLARIAYRVA